MKRYLRSFLWTAAAGLAVIACAVSCTRKAPPAPFAVVPQTSYDFSRLDAGDIVTHDFRIQNTGTAPLFIQGIMSTSRSMFAQVSNREIAPGKDTVLSVRLDTKGLNGRVDNKVLVYTNAANKRVLAFKITASVQQLFTVQPGRVDFGDIHTSRALGMTVVFTAPSFGITSVTSSSPFVRAKLHRSGDRSYTITVRIGRDLPAGLLRGAVIVNTDSPRYPVLTIPVKADRISDLRANPGKIFAGILLKGRSSTVFSTYIYSRKKRPFTVKRASDTNTFLDIDIQQFAPDVYRLNVRVKPFAHAGEYTTDIIVHTSDPKTPVLQIPFRVIVMDK